MIEVEKKKCEEEVHAVEDDAMELLSQNAEKEKANIEKMEKKRQNAMSDREKDKEAKSRKRDQAINEWCERRAKEILEEKNAEVRERKEAEMMKAEDEASRRERDFTRRALAAYDARNKAILKCFANNASNAAIKNNSCRLFI